MELLTQDIIAKLPPLESTCEIPLEEKIAVCKFFYPAGPATWFVVEGEKEVDEESGKEDWMLWGWACLNGDKTCAEWGHFRLSELQSFRGRFGFQIERDIHFPLGTDKVSNHNWRYCS